MSAVDAPPNDATVIGVRFRRAGRLYYFDPLDIQFRVNEYAIVDTPRGQSAARVVLERTQVARNELRGGLKPVVRKASADDLSRMAAFRDEEPQAERVFAEKIAASRLPMQPVKAEYSFDGGTLTLHFSSTASRVDFSTLAQDLAATFRTRVELRRVGPRERARLRTGLGRCGRELCCATFLTELDTVTLRMPKDQNLPLNPDKISGVCGRLLCCLQYEHEGYLADKLAAEQENGGGCATEGKCGTCGVHDLRAELGQPVAPDVAAVDRDPSGRDSPSADSSDPSTSSRVRPSVGPPSGRRRRRRGRGRGS